MDIRSFIEGFFLGVVIVTFVVIIIKNSKKIKADKESKKSE